MPSIEQQLDNLEQQRKKLNQALQRKRANKTFECVCGSKHKIKDCTAIQTHWYVPPHGCTGGDYWNEGELQIVCPDTGVHNRILFDIPYEFRDRYDTNVESQFKRIYTELFAEVVEVHGKVAPYRWDNNFYFDTHRKKFDLKIVE